MTAKDASGTPVAFTDPVNIRVQFRDGSTSSYDDLYDLEGERRPARLMHLFHDVDEGNFVDFQPAMGYGERILDLEAGTVEVQDLTGLTGPSGAGTWGAIPYVPPPTAARPTWAVYE